MLAYIQDVLDSYNPLCIARTVLSLFSIYITGLRNILQRHSVHCHLYADNIQIFVSFPPNQTQASQALHNLEKCIADIDAWMKSNSLQLNHSKCEFILFGSKSQLNKLDINSISISIW